MDEGVLRGKQRELAALGRRRHGRNEIQFARLEQRLGFGPAAGRYQSELETGPGAHHIEQVGDEPLELTRTVDLAHRWPVRCNAELERGMQGQPIQLALVEDNLARAMGQFIVDYAPRLQNAAPILKGDVVERQLQQFQQSLIIGSHCHGQRGIRHPVRGDHFQAGLLLQALQAYQGRQIGQIGVCQPFFHHEDGLVTAVCLRQLVHAQLLKVLTGAESLFTHPA